MSTINLIFTQFLPRATRQLAESFQEVLTKNFDESEEHPIKLAHFDPCSRFEQGYDMSTGDQYLEENQGTTRLKCLGLVLATPIVHSMATILNLANRVSKLILFGHFWHSDQTDLSYKERAWSYGKDLLRVALLPIILVGLELSALYGLALPENGRKLYATFERCAYGKELLAPCFQPHPSHHLGDTYFGSEYW